MRNFDRICFKSVLRIQGISRIKIHIVFPCHLRHAVYLRDICSLVLGDETDAPRVPGSTRRDNTFVADYVRTDQTGVRQGQKKYDLSSCQRGS